MLSQRAEGEDSSAFPSPCQARGIGAERVRFIRPFACHNGLAGDRSLGIWQHPARVVVGAAANTADAFSS
jgi:hypothetical protein